jgi:hypothetical protein
MNSQQIKEYNEIVEMFLRERQLHDNIIKRVDELVSTNHYMTDIISMIKQEFQIPSWNKHWNMSLPALVRWNIKKRNVADYSI